MGAVGAVLVIVVAGNDAQGTFCSQGCRNTPSAVSPQEAVTSLRAFSPLCSTCSLKRERPAGSGEKQEDKGRKVGKLNAP